MLSRQILLNLCNYGNDLIMYINSIYYGIHVDGMQNDCCMRAFSLAHSKQGNKHRWNLKLMTF
jgi:hypothetical protein